MTAKNLLRRMGASKKGGEAAETTEVNIGQSIPSVIVVLIFVGIIVSFYSLTQKTAYAAGPQESFYQLVTKLEALDEGRLADGIGHAFYIGENHYLFGFNDDPDEVVYKGGRVEKPREKCGSTEACVCICNKKDCRESVSCNVRLKNDRVVPVPFKNIKYLVVKADADPKNKLNKGMKLDARDVPSGGNYLAIFGNNWKQGRVIYLKREGNKVEITFPAAS